MIQIFDVFAIAAAMVEAATAAADDLLMSNANSGMNNGKKK